MEATARKRAMQEGTNKARHANHLTAVAFYANRDTQAAHVGHVKTSSRKADK